MISKLEFGPTDIEQAFSDDSVTKEKLVKLYFSLKKAKRLSNVETRYRTIYDEAIRINTWMNSLEPQHHYHEIDTLKDVFSYAIIDISHFLQEEKLVNKTL